MKVVRLSGGNQAQAVGEAAGGDLRLHQQQNAKPVTESADPPYLSSRLILLGQERGGRQREGSGEAGAQCGTLQNGYLRDEKPGKAISRPSPSAPRLPAPRSASDRGG